MSIQNITAELLAEATIDKIEKDAHGIMLMDLPRYDYNVYLNTLASKVSEKKHKKPYIFFVGFTEEEQAELKQMLDKELDLEIYYTVEAAEKFRHNKEVFSARIVIVKRFVPKLTSLKWFEKIQVKEIYDSLCKLAQEEFKHINNNIERLWKAFKHNSIRNIISLERLVDYYQYLIQLSEDIPNQSVYQLYRLGLLVDESLFENTNFESIRSKLLENYKTVNRLRQLDKADQKALQSSEITGGTKIRANILSFYQSRSNEALKNLTLSEVVKILAKVNKQKRRKKNEETENGEDNGSGNRSRPPVPLNPDSVGMDLIIEHEEEQIKDMLDQIEEQFNGWGKGKKESISVESEHGSKSKVEFIPEVFNLIDAFIGENSFGGIVRTEEKTPTDVLNSINKNNIEQFDGSYIDIIREKLNLLIEEFSEEAKEVLDLFDLFIHKRKVIYNHAYRLSDSPILKIVESDETYSNLIDYIDTYTHFMKQLRSNFNKFSSYSAPGTKELVAMINTLDMVYVIGSEKFHSILSPLNPLYLWKYVELTRRIKATSSSLSDLDKEFLIRATDDIPNPLITVFISSIISNSKDEVIAEVGKIGRLPIYSSEQQVNQISDGLEAVKKSFDKFINLYPHSKNRFRVAFINPPDVKSILDLIKDKINNKIITGIHIDVFKTKETSQQWSNLEKADEEILALLGENNAFTLRIHSKTYEFEYLVNKFKPKQYHSIVLFDPSKRAVSEVKTESRLNLRIHPLCVPKVFQYDPMTDRLEIIPSSDGNIFSDHHELIARLNDRPRGWHNTVVASTESIKGILEKVINSTEWLVIADPNLKNFEISTIGSKNCIYYQSGSYREVGVYSKNWSKLTNGIDNIIREIGNYDPKSNCLELVLKEIQALNERGILNLASLSTNQTFNQNHGKGAIGTAISSFWYKKNNIDGILASLDTDLARTWLSEREDKTISDLIGIRKVNEFQAEIEIIEVKTYKSYSIEKSMLEDGTEINEIKGEAVDQLNSVYKIIHEIFFETDKITSVSRRELLRYQVFKVLHSLGMDKSKKKMWTSFINDLFAGNIEINIKLSLYHVCFNLKGKTLDEGIKCVAENDVALYEIKDDFIEGILTNCGERERFNKEVSTNEHLHTDRNKSNHNENFYHREEIEFEIGKANDRVETKLPDNVLDTHNPLSNVTADDKNKIPGDEKSDNELEKFIEVTANSIKRAMKDFAIDVLEVDPSKALIASRFVRFRVRLRPGETLQKILRVRSDIAREIEATSEILIDNERGTNFIYVDVPREKTDAVNLLDFLNIIPTSHVGNLKVILGQDPSGAIEILDIAKAPHLLTAGSTGSGKTIFLYSIIVSLISQYNENELELVIVDPKQTDFIFFEGLPHLRNGEVIIEAEDAVNILNDLVQNELPRRTNLLRQSRNRDIFTYNENNPEQLLKPILVIVDEYADLVSVADLEGNKQDFERNMIRLAQRSRNVGIHLVIATQRPSADIVTSRLKANVPTRISFSLPANQDSRTILDASGAEDLLGKGDMLYSINGDLRRLQGLYINEEDLQEFLFTKYNI